MSIYIIIALLFAGILKQLISVPVCLYYVIPVAQGLNKEEACKGAIQSF